MSKLIKTAEEDSPYLAPLSYPLPPPGGDVTIANIIDTQYLGYKAKVLVWDLYHFKDPDSSYRLGSAPDKTFYICHPYFSQHEAEYIANARTRVHQDRVGAPYVQSVRDALLEHFKAFGVDRHRRLGDIANNTLPTPQEIAHIYLFVFGITFVQLGGVRFQRQLSKYGLRPVPWEDFTENTYEKLESGPLNTVQYSGSGVYLPKITGITG
ncbi:hypothetical protein F4813DRAFT_399964 [Daldinia decipiens]|uniref:uncharacterized protein n=1 Tax=Daldinia decipiens TaxID=326647 RepID=UPI0020C398BE|nr:uncharacterized protein F4813DRAFT_399964 [Daldinia decipiens]KAI1653344.1 hypothetical protein F4813DRAFT_399964 [Daldinia decipiens]